LKFQGRHYRTIWPAPGGDAVEVIDQTLLPFRFEVRRLASCAEVETGIRSMIVRGAPLIGAAAAYGVGLAMRQDPGDTGLASAIALLRASRPTAVNLGWALDRIGKILQHAPPAQRFELAWREAARICDEDAESCRAIGRNGLSLIEQAARRKQQRVNILTHCNAGWLATVDFGTALSPVYAAHDAGLDVHVWVDETRPRNQGASLTAFELGAHGVPHTIIADNAGGHLMQHGEVDLCIVGADRIASNGDAANKIGTYLKALAARDNDVPFYVAAPLSTIDWTILDGVQQIPIEERSAREVTHMTGMAENGELQTLQVTAPGSAAANPAFDVTPARLITFIITERGVVKATTESLAALKVFA
jgi:methylthioribose-1-phosphate isomerase